MNIAKMMKQAQDLQRKMEEAQQQLEATEVEGSSGAGMVTLSLTGKHELRRISVDPSLLVADEVEMLEDLIIAAYNDAQVKLQALTQERMASVTSGLNLPAGMKLPF